MRIVRPGEGEVIGDTPQRRVELLCDHEAVHATISRFGPGQEGAALHVHRRHHDLFYVVEGELTLHLGDADDVKARTGTLVCVPPLVVHGFGNTGDAPMRYLNLHAPGSGFATYMRGLRDGERVLYDQEEPPATGTRPSSDVWIGRPPLTIEAVTVTETPGGGGTSQRLECFYVLSGPRAGTWIQFPPGVPHAFDGDEAVVHVSAG